jgi:hypothetical protein
VSDTERMATALERLATVIEAYISSGAGAASSSPPPPPAAQAFAAQAAPAATGPTDCPIHNVAFKTHRTDGTPYKRAFCSRKNDDGSYCDQKGPWLG